MDPFATLGAPRSYDLDLKSLEKTHRELSRALHPDRFASASPAERREATSRAVEVNEAWRIVRDPIRRAEALLALRGVAMGDGREPSADPEFLMEMLERREALSEARASRDGSAVRRLATAIEARQSAVTKALAAAFAREGGDVELVRMVGELRFFRRFLDEVGTIEDDLAGAPASL